MWENFNQRHESRDSAFEALRRRRSDLAAMILKSAWWTREIDPVEALCTGDVELVKSMILAGTDFTKPPVVRNAAINNPVGAIACLRAVGILLESVEGQLYEALMHHADHGHGKRLIAMLRSGLDPRKRIVIYENPDGRKPGSSQGGAFPPMPTTGAPTNHPLIRNLDRPSAPLRCRPRRLRT